MDIPAAGPTGTRTTIKFNNIPHGMFISGEKLLIDAKNFRRAARLLEAHGGEEEAKIASWLLGYADMCQNASGGMETSAPARAYDRDVKPDYVRGDDTIYGD